MSQSSDSSSDKPQGLDLEALRGLEFSPQWSTGSSSSSSTPSRSREDHPRSRSSGAPRDRRPARKRTGPGPSTHGSGRDSGRPEPYRPIVTFSIYPEDEPFDLLTESIRSSLKVYELFEISRLILEKVDRMVVVVTPLTDESAPLYECLPDRQIFRDETEALNHSANFLLPSVFEEREEKVDPPSGKFTSVIRCTVTGKLLPPRSYHRFQALLQEHHRLNCPDTPFSRVEKGLESVQDDEAVQEWLQSMSQRSVFRLRSEESGESEEKAHSDEAVDESVEVAQEREEANEPSSAISGDSPESSDDSEADASVVAEEATEEGTEEPASEETEKPSESPSVSTDSSLVFDTREAAINHLIRTQKEKLVRETRQARVPGRSLMEAADAEIGRSFSDYVERQKRFPLDTANNVRMKLRKGKFFIFKKGKKGISYVSAVRRKNRPKDAVFADSVGKIISVLEANSAVKVKDLPNLLSPAPAEGTMETEGKVEDSRQWSKDLRWLKSEGYVYEYGDGSLEIHPLEADPRSSGSKPTKVEDAEDTEDSQSEGADEPKEKEPPPQEAG